MPKRVIDFDALWASDKLAACAEWAQTEYAWLYGLADASGSFEMTNLRVIWGRVAAIRKNLTLERLEQIFGEFVARGLLFVWEENGKRYGHWTGSDVPGRLPPPSWRARLERLAPPVPRDALAAYTARFGSRSVAARATERQTAERDRGGFPQTPALRRDSAAASGEAENFGGRVSVSSRPPDAARGLKGSFEGPQAQDWNLDWDMERKEEKTQECRLFPGFYENANSEGQREPDGMQQATAAQASAIGSQCEQRHDDRQSAPVHRSCDAETEERCGKDRSAERLLAIYEAERGPLPPAERLTAERRRRSRRRLAAGLAPKDFRAAVRRAAATPFLTGAGERGWRASFDWFIANDTNVRKVLEGCYDAAKARRGADAASLSAAGRNGLPESFAGQSARRSDRVLAELHAGAGPLAEACGVRAKPAALERFRAREAGQPPGLFGAPTSRGSLPAVPRSAEPQKPMQGSQRQAAENVREKAS